MRTQNRWASLLRWLLVIALPVVLLAVNLRLVTGHWFVRWEYRRAEFPPDPFGLSTAERVRLATVCQDFLATNADISLLEDLQLPDGQSAFNQRELQHMSDVQAVYHALSIAGAAAALIWIAGGAALIASNQAREQLLNTCVNGSLFTLGLLVVVGAFMVLSWGDFFTTFHRLFFEGNSWIFPPSDTLIRLFPIRFWIDIAAALVGLLVLEAVGIGGLGHALRARGSRD